MYAKAKCMMTFVPYRYSSFQIDCHAGYNWERNMNLILDFSKIAAFGEEICHFCEEKSQTCYKLLDIEEKLDGRKQGILIFGEGILYFS